MKIPINALTNKLCIFIVKQERSNSFEKKKLHYIEWQIFDEKRMRFLKREFG